MKVFLGGTCNESTWRDELINILPKHINYFNPVVEDWTSSCQKEEEKQKYELCDVHLYVITPKMTGVFSIAELVESAMTKNKDAVFCYLKSDDDKEFDNHQLKSLKATAALVEKYGAYVCHNIDEVVSCLEELYDAKSWGVPV